MARFYASRERPPLVHKKESALLPHILDRSPTTGSPRIHEEEVRPYGRTSTIMPFLDKIVVVFRSNDLLALMLNSIFSAHLDFSPPAPKSCSHLQNATNYTISRKQIPTSTHSPSHDWKYGIIAGVLGSPKGMQHILPAETRGNGQYADSGDRPILRSAGAAVLS